MKTTTRAITARVEYKEEIMRDLPVAYGNSRMAKKWSNKTIKYEDLIERLKNTKRTTETVAEYKKMSKADRDSVKDTSGCFVAGKLKDGRRDKESVVSRSMISQDVDHANAAYIDNIKMLSPYDSIIYSTHSHTPQEPRLRHVYPLTRDVSPDEYAAISRYLAAEQGIEQFDECSFRPNQLMYYPSTPMDGEYVFEHIEGDWLDPDVFLAAHPDWRDCSLLPTTPHESEVKKAGKKQEDPLGKGGVVGAFCRCYGIREAIEKFLSDVYEPSAMEGRYDYIPADSTAGVQIYDDKFAYSHHATDPACGLLLNSFDLVRVHKFGEDGFKDMCEFAVKDEKVGKLMLEEKRAEAAAEFEDWDKGLQRDKSGDLINNLHNINLILANDDYMKNIVFNPLADGMEIKGPVPW